MQNAHWEYTTKSADGENITKAAQMAQVLAVQPGSSEHAAIAGLVDSSGIISPHSFYSLLTSWNNWDLYGIFTSQPGFYPPTPFMPAFEPLSLFGRLHLQIYAFCITGQTAQIERSVVSQPSLRFPSLRFME